MALAPCKLTADCDPYLTNTLCYFNTTGSGFCNCNAYYAWTGPDCKDLSAASNVQAAWSIIVLLVCIPLTALSVYSTVRAWRRLPRELVPIDKLMNERVATNALITLATFCCANWGLSRALNVAEVEGVPEVVFLSGPEDLEYGFNGRYEAYQDVVGAGATVIFSLLGISNVFMVWIKIAQRTATLNLVQGDFNKYWIYVRAFQVAALIIMLIANITDRLQETVGSSAGFIIVFLNGVMTAGYVFGRNLLVPLMMNLQAHTAGDRGLWRTRFQPLITNINRTTVAMVLSLNLASLSWLSYSALDSFYEGSDRLAVFGGSPDQEPAMHPAVVADMMTMTGYCCTCATAAVFLFASGKTPVANQTKQEESILDHVEEEGSNKRSPPLETMSNVVSNPKNDDGEEVSF